MRFQHSEGSGLVLLRAGGYPAESVYMMAATRRGPGGGASLDSTTSPLSSNWSQCYLMSLAFPRIIRTRM
jgi:hypothetical protein